MYHPNTPLFRNFLIFMLVLQPLATAKGNELFMDGNSLQVQIQQLQTQTAEINGKIRALETALNTTHQEIRILRNSIALNTASAMRTGTNQSITKRTANGHGR